MVSAPRKDAGLGAAHHSFGQPSLSPENNCPAVQEPSGLFEVMEWQIWQEWC